MSVREKGVATTPCPSCGADLPLAEQPDGSTAAGVCPSCYPADEKEKAEKRPAREKATDVAVDQEENEQ